jgi:hypothetical protein
MIYKGVQRVRAGRVEPGMMLARPVYGCIRITPPMDRYRTISSKAEMASPYREL